MIICGKAPIFQVKDIFDEGKKIAGICDTEKVYRWFGDAASLIVNKADLEGLKGWIDVCSVGCGCTGTSPCGGSCGRRCITLPMEVETVLAITIGGRPALGYGQNFNFHLNGPGDCRCSCDWSWMDMGANHYTYRDLITPAKLVAFLETPEDNNKSMIVLGYDNQGNVLKRQVAGEWKAGYAVPMIYGAALPDDEAPTIARITGVHKDITVGSVRLSTLDSSGQTGVLLGVYEGSQTVPQFRRVSLNKMCNWARVAYMKGSPTFRSMDDHIPLKSRRAFLLAMQAVKSYADLQLGEAHAFEADAARLEIEAQMKLDAPLFFPLSVVDLNGLRDKSDQWLE